MRDWSGYVVPVTRLEAFKALKFVVARLEDCRVLKLYKMESFRALKCSRFESFMTLKFFTLESFRALKFKIVPDMAHRNYIILTQIRNDLDSKIVLKIVSN